jgi:biopolymer transport protein TolQ
MVNPIFTSYQQSDLLGKIIFLLLFAASVTTWTFFIKKWLQIKDIRKEGISLKTLLSKKLLNPMQIDDKKRQTIFYSLFSALQTSAHRYFQKNSFNDEGKERSFLETKDLAEIESELLLNASEKVKHIEKNMFILSTIVTLAPFLGLLGTVWGILITFLDLQTHHGHRAESAMMGGLAMALATTVVGLIVAIPALVSYNYLKSQLSLLRHEIHGFSQTLIHNLGHFYCRAER